MDLLICHHTTSFNNGPPRVVWEMEMNTTFYFLKDKGDGEGLAGGSLQGGAPPWEGLGWWALGRLWRLCGPGPGDPGWAPGVLGAPRAPGPGGLPAACGPCGSWGPRVQKAPRGSKGPGAPRCPGALRFLGGPGPQKKKTRAISSRGIAKFRKIKNKNSIFANSNVQNQQIL